MIHIPTALRCLVEMYPRAHVVSSCGYITRDLLATGDRQNNFYLVGSMGMAAPIAAGISAGAPAHDVIAIDGDGSCAMNIGGMLVAARHGRRLLHIVLDDGVHDSTGGQETLRPDDLVRMAHGAGYAMTADIASLDELRSRTTFPSRPALWHLRCLRRDYPIGPRLRLPPAELRSRFTRAIANETEESQECTGV